MHSALRAIVLYRWELAPLLVYGFLVPPLEHIGVWIARGPSLGMGSFLGMGLGYTAGVLVLVALLPRAHRQGKPLLTALWLLIIVAMTALAVQRLILGTTMMMSTLTAAQTSMVYAGIAILGLIGLLGIVAWIAPRGMDLALLVAAASIAPKDPLVTFMGLFGSLTALGFDIAMTAAPLLRTLIGLVTIGVIAFAFANADRLPTRTVYRIIVLLLSLAMLHIIIAIGASTIYVALNRPSNNALLVPFLLTIGVTAAQWVVVMGSTWAVAMARLALRRKAAHG